MPPGNDNSFFSPQIAQQLFQQGKISKETLDAALGQSGGLSATPIGGSSPAFDPLGLQSPNGASMGNAPPATLPTLNIPGLRTLPPDAPGSTPTDQGLQSAPSGSKRLPNGMIEEPGGISMARKSTPAGPPSPAAQPQAPSNDVSHPDTDRDSAGEGSGLPKGMSGKGWSAAQEKAAHPAKKNADETYYDELVADNERKNDIGIDKKIATNEEHDAFAAGQEHASKQIDATIQDQQQQIQRDDQFKQDAITKAQHADDVAKDRAKELANSKIDRKRWWKSLDGGQQVISGLALLGSGLASGATGKNPVMDSWNKAIDNDVSDQMTELQNKKEGWQMEDNIAAREYARSGDWLNYQKAKRLEGLNLLSQQVQSTLMQSKSDAIKAQGKQAVSDIDNQIDDARMGIVKQRYALDKGKEQAAAAAAAQQASRVEKTRMDVRAMTEKLVTEKGMSVEDAHKAAYATVTGMNPGGGAIPHVASKEEIDAKYRAPTKEQKDATEIKTGAEQAFKNIDAMKESKGLSEMGYTDEARKTVGNTTKDQAAADAINHEIFSIASPFIHDATGRINESELKELKDTYYIKAGEGLDVRKQHLDALKIYVARRAAAKGVELEGGPSPTSTGSPSTKPLAIPEGVNATVRK